MTVPPALPQVGLRTEVLQLLRQIPGGRVTTYGDLARALGDDKARSARWLGEFLQSHPHAQDCPCHRVVRATGEIGLHHTGDPRRKAALLEREGVTVSPVGKADVANRWTQFVGTRPLEQLREFQKLLVAQVREIPLSAPPGTIAGVDVAYRADGTGCGAYVLLDAATLETLAELTLTLPVEFPYIPGYLTFRELPIMLALCRQAAAQGQLADVIFCDGNGRLHPWRAGIAACLGAMLGHPVIGVGKSLLCGRIEPANSQGADKTKQGGRVRCAAHGPVERRLAPGAIQLPAIVDAGEIIGRVIQSSPHGKPYYVSVGNYVTLDEAAEIARSAARDHRLPEPIHLADRLTKRLKNSAPPA
jgi:deoxyribonuclease V